MPDQGFTIEPVYLENDQGQQVLSDMSVRATADRGVGRDGQVRDWQFDYQEDSEGRIHHLFQDAELQSERQDGNSFDEASYIDALIEANPDITEAQQWAVDNLPEAWVEEYDKMIETGDLDELNKAVEWLLDQYANREDASESEPQEDMEEMEEDDELSEEETEILNNVVESLQRQEARPEYEDDWQEVVEQAEEAGDEAYALVAAATAAFHAGDVDADDAIAYCLENVPLKDLARVYKQMTEE